MKAFRRWIPAILAAVMLIPVAGLAEQADEWPVRIEQDPESVSMLEWRVYSGEEPQDVYQRPERDRIRMPAGVRYSKLQIGVLTFRNDAFRQNAAFGVVTAPLSFREIWRVETGSVKGAGREYSGMGWSSQPAIIKWAVEIRKGSNIREEKKEKSALKEVIAACLDGTIRFLDLEDGTQTRDSVKLGYPMGGTPSLSPSGFPYMSVGQLARKIGKAIGEIGLRQYNLYDQTEFPLIDGRDGGLNRHLSKDGSFDTSALIDRKSDTMITAGSNGMLYLISLNSSLDWQDNTYEIDPSAAVLVTKNKGMRDAGTAVRSSPAMMDRYVFYADMAGILRCVDTDTLTPMWAADTGDSVLAAVALDQPEIEALALYTGNMLNNRPEGKAQIRRYDALTGKEIWRTEISVDKRVEAAGCQASPAIGRYLLNDLVFFTVTGLDDVGCEEAGVPWGTKAALLALEKETGAIRWACALDDASVSSPVAVYDEDGNGWVIQCMQCGTMFLVDGLTGEIISALTVDGRIESSPAVYHDIMVVGTTGKGTSYIYGISLRGE